MQLLSGSAHITWIPVRAASGHVGDVPLRQVVSEQLPQDLVVRVSRLEMSACD